MTEAPEAVTLGEAMVLLLGEPGMPLAAAGSYRRSVAGAESNVAIGLARLGHRVGWVGRVGNDTFGQVVLRRLRAEGVDVRGVRLDPAATGVLIRDCVGDRPVEVLYHRRESAGAQLTAADIDPAYVGAARVVHLSGVTALLGAGPRAAAARAIDVARDAGTRVCFDANIRRRLAAPGRAQELIAPLAARADIVLATEDEAGVLSGRAGDDAAADWFLERGARLVVIKRGERGSWATDGTRRWEQPAWPATTIDPVGAGDAFAAGLLSAWLRDRAPQLALAEAAAVAALCVGVPTDVDGLPGAAERDARMAGETEVRR
jgi:2-dehydro-3-deoxygluconokinase